VLLSGDHAAIEAWRRAEALAATRTKRPDLFARHEARRQAAGEPREPASGRRPKRPDLP
jgi:tRNA (guanine37-N1)-methyltransferase